MGGGGGGGGLGAIEIISIYVPTTLSMFITYTNLNDKTVIAVKNRILAQDRFEWGF